ncbi:ribonuclease VapC5 [Ignicoccus pacificus DSM 13166]|uniref:Ribonuclease VapC5 n=1 Tax=Ignicoccus pacificus DSM 13166 TaxID=940294 RepID=A0A977K9P3_9CREN|nr:ribonuclease VapC5 [Ignicoccus pacificus DSM 13166]
MRSLRPIVHDTGSLLAGMPALMPGENYTTPDNLEEVKDSNSKSALERYIYKLKVVSPDQRYVKIVMEKARELGEDLSETDVKVVALALQLNALLLSDDYGVLNVAQALGIEWKSVRTKGIDGNIKWEKFCPACKRSYPPEYKVCPVCGTVLKRRVRGKRKRRRDG